LFLIVELKTISYFFLPQVKVSFPAPRMLISCENMEYDRACLRLSTKAPCQWTNTSQCTWLGVKYKTVTDVTSLRR
jgi:hypothetical protein